jgi:prevent-host-death family protein
MKNATLRQLRNETDTLVKWVEAGETVLVTKRSKPLFRLLPAMPVDSGISRLPDFEARQREIFPEGDLPVTGAELLAEERGLY